MKRSGHELQALHHLLQACESTSACRWSGTQARTATFSPSTPRSGPWCTTETETARCGNRSPHRPAGSRVHGADVRVDGPVPGRLHAKLVVADRRAAFVTSANLTRNALMSSAAALGPFRGAQAGQRPAALVAHSNLLSVDTKWPLPGPAAELEHRRARTATARRWVPPPAAPPHRLDAHWCLSEDVRRRCRSRGTRSSFEWSARPRLQHSDARISATGACNRRDGPHLSGRVGGGGSRSKADYQIGTLYTRSSARGRTCCSRAESTGAEADCARSSD